MLTITYEAYTTVLEHISIAPHITDEVYINYAASKTHAYSGISLGDPFPMSRLLLRSLGTATALAMLAMTNFSMMRGLSHSRLLATMT